MNSFAVPPFPADEFWPHFGEDEVAAVVEVLRSGRVNQWTGDRVTAFEREFETRFGGHAVAVANGSIALELSLRSLGIGPGDEVIVTPRSHIASASCVGMVGAKPVFADVDRDSQTITPISIMPLIGRRTKAIIAVHLAGWPCNMPGIMALADLNGLLVIEDCAEAIGASISRQPVGSFGHAAAFSFGDDQIITTGGEGGLALFRDEAARTRAWSLKDHGKNLALSMTPPDGPGFRWLHETVGTNGRLTEMQAAIGLVQLGKLEAWLERRRSYAKVWFEGLRASQLLRLPRPETRFEHAHYKVYAFLKPERMRQGATRDDVLAALNEAGIRAFAGACPEIYREAVFAGLKVRTLPIAKELGETSLMFECHPTLNSFRVPQMADRARAIIDHFDVGE